VKGAPQPPVAGLQPKPAAAGGESSVVSFVPEAASDLVVEGGSLSAAEAMGFHPSQQVGDEMGEPGGAVMDTAMDSGFGGRGGGGGYGDDRDAADEYGGANAGGFFRGASASSSAEAATGRGAGKGLLGLAGYYRNALDSLPVRHRRADGGRGRDVDEGSADDDAEAAVLDAFDDYRSDNYHSGGGGGGGRGLGSLGRALNGAAGSSALEDDLADLHADSLTPSNGGGSGASFLGGGSGLGGDSPLATAALLGLPVKLSRANVEAAALAIKSSHPDLRDRLQAFLVAPGYCFDDPPSEPPARAPSGNGSFHSHSGGGAPEDVHLGYMRMVARFISIEYHQQPLAAAAGTAASGTGGLAAAAAASPRAARDEALTHACTLVLEFLRHLQPGPLDAVVADDALYGAVLQALEFTPYSKLVGARHYEEGLLRSTMRCAVPLQNTELESLCKETFRLSYLKGERRACAHLATTRGPTRS